MNTTIERMSEMLAKPFVAAVAGSFTMFAQVAIKSDWMLKLSEVNTYISTTALMLMNVTIAVNYFCKRWKRRHKKRGKA